MPLLCAAFISLYLKNKNPADSDPLKYSFSFPETHMFIVMLRLAEMEVDLFHSAGEREREMPVLLKG